MMNNRNIVILIGVAFLVLISCNDRRNVKKSLYRDGVIRSEREYIITNNDTIYNGLSSFYDTIGLKYADIFFKNNLKSGKEFQYYPSGKIKAVLYNFNNKMDSIATWYYENGMLQDSCFYNKGNVIGDRTYYYESGELKNYFYHSVIDSGLLRVKWSYDKIGNIAEVEGDTILMEIISEKSYIKIGDTLSYKYHLMYPPNTQTFFSCVLYKDDGSIVNVHDIGYEEYSKNPIDFKYVFNDEGKYVIVSLCRIMKDTIVVGEKVLRYQISIDK